VINYDLPHNPEDYVHRIGRTARVEASGVATSFVTHADRRYVSGVRKLIGDKLPAPVTVDGFDVSDEPAPRPPKRRGKRGTSGRSRSGGRRRQRSASK